MECFDQLHGGYLFENFRALLQRWKLFLPYVYEAILNPDRAEREISVTLLVSIVSPFVK